VTGYAADTNTITVQTAFTNAINPSDQFTLTRTLPATAEVNAVEGIPTDGGRSEVQTLTLTVEPVETDVVDSVIPPTTTVFDGRASLSSENDYYNGATITFAAGVLGPTLQQSVVLDYDGTTKTFTLQATGVVPGIGLTVAPSVGDDFTIEFPGSALHTFDLQFDGVTSGAAALNVSTVTAADVRNNLEGIGALVGNVVVAGPTGGPHVKVFDGATGRHEQPFNSELTPPTSSFTSTALLELRSSCRHWRTTTMSTSEPAPSTAWSPARSMSPRSSTTRSWGSSTR
jgi:hypothetical protein